MSWAKDVAHNMLISAVSNNLEHRCLMADFLMALPLVVRSFNVMV